jgi:phytol kinase
VLTAFWLNTAIKLFLLCIISYGTGSLVFHKDVKVNYTRKINHFALFIIPMVLDRMIPFGRSIETFMLSAILTVATLFIYIQPVRSRVPFVRRMFLSFDRPEDRPYTLKWLSTQIIAGYIIIVPAIILFLRLGYGTLVFIPVLINGFGDGLAEPVGVRFGKHQYRTRALFSGRTYERSLEGSACVFLASIVVLFIFQSSFSDIEFIVALAALPMAMTLAEAFSPHTWDTPFLFLTGYTVLYGIKTIPFA